jgi:hypothetical protein
MADCHGRLSWAIVKAERLERGAKDIASDLTPPVHALGNTKRAT